MIALDTGLLEWVDAIRRGGLKLIEDPEAISTAPTSMEPARQRDNSDQALRQAVIARDGDQCRWCGVEDYWPGKTRPARAHSTI